MTAQELKFLKLARKLVRKSDLGFYYDPYDTSLHTQLEPYSSVRCSKISSEINGILRSLLNKEYIEQLPHEGMDPDYYRLTHKGLHYLHFSLETLISFLFKSIIVPIIVALLTSLVATHYQNDLSTSINNMVATETTAEAITESFTEISD